MMYMYRKYLKVIFGAFIMAASLLRAQTYVAKGGTAHFFSTTPLEDIEATSKEATSVFNTQTGELIVSMPIKSFQFSKKLMQEHFNENYMESDKYPKADFKGKILDLKSFDLSKDGTYAVKVVGELSIHGVKKNRTIDASFTVKGGVVTAYSKFKVVLEDHKVERPQIVWEKIAEVVDVDVNFVYTNYVKK